MIRLNHHYILTIIFAFTIVLSLLSSQKAKIHNDSNVSNLSAAILDCAYTKLFRQTVSSAHDPQLHLRVNGSFELK